MKFHLTAILCVGTSIVGWCFGKSTLPATTTFLSATPVVNSGTTTGPTNTYSRFGYALSPADFPARLRYAMQANKGSEAAWLAELWATNDPAGLFAFLMRPESMGLMAKHPTVQGICFHHWLQKDYNAALSAMPQLPTVIDHNGFHGSVAASAVRELIKLNPQSAVDFIMQHQHCVLHNIFDPSVSLANLQEIARALGPCRTRGVLAQDIFLALAKGNPGRAADLTAAQQWLTQCSPEERMWMLNVNPVKPIFSDGQAELMTSFSDSDLSELDKAAHRDQALMHRLAQWRAFKDPAAALAWAQGSLDGLDRAWAMKEIFRVAAPTDAQAAAEFVDAIPAGPTRDQAVAAVIEKFRRTGSTAAAAAWVLNLPDAKDQRVAVRSLMERWPATNPNACAEWIQAAPESLQMTALTTAYRGNGFASQVKLAAQLPEELAIQGLQKTWENISYPDPRNLAEQAATLPEGKLRALFMAEASGQSYLHFGYGYNDRWLEWAANLPTAEDRAAALHGAEHPRHGYSGLSETMKATATARLLGKATK